MDTLAQNLEYKNHNQSFSKLGFHGKNKLQKHLKKYKLLKTTT